MFFIVKVKIEGFRSIRHATLKFDKGVNILAGPNGAGKSNILYAIEYALGIVPMLVDDSQRRSITFDGQSDCSVNLTLAFSEQNYDNRDIPRADGTAWRLRRFGRSLNDGTEIFSVGDFKNYSLQDYRLAIATMPFVIGTSVALNLDQVQAFMQMSCQDRLKYILSAVGVTQPVENAWVHEECLAQLEQEAQFSLDLKRDYRRLSFAAEIYEEFREIEMKLNTCKFCILQNDLREHSEKTIEITNTKDDLLEDIGNTKNMLDELNLEHRVLLDEQVMLEEQLLLDCRYGYRQQRETEQERRDSISETVRPTKVFTGDELAAKEIELDNEVRDFDQMLETLMTSLKRSGDATERRADIMLRHERTKCQFRTYFTSKNELDDAATQLQSWNERKDRLNETISQLRTEQEECRDEISTMKNLIARDKVEIAALEALSMDTRSAADRTSFERIKAEEQLFNLLNSEHNAIEKGIMRVGETLFGEHWPTRWMITMIVRQLTNNGDWLASQYCGMLIDLIRFKTSTLYDSALLSAAGSNLFTVIVKTSEGANRLLEHFAIFSQDNGIHPPLVITSLDSVVSDGDELDFPSFEFQYSRMMDLLDFEERHTKIVEFYFKRVIVLRSELTEELISDFEKLNHLSTCPVELVTRSGKICHTKKLTAANHGHDPDLNKFQLLDKFKKLEHDLETCVAKLNEVETNLNALRSIKLKAASDSRTNKYRKRSQLMKTQLNLISLITSAKQRTMIFFQKIAERELACAEIALLNDLPGNGDSYEWTAEKLATVQQLGDDLQNLRTELPIDDKELESEIDRLITECASKKSIVESLGEDILCGEVSMDVLDGGPVPGEQAVIVEMENEIAKKRERSTEIQTEIEAKRIEMEDCVKNLRHLENQYTSTVMSLTHLTTKSKACQSAIGRLQCLTRDSLAFMSNTARDEIVSQPMKNLVENQDPKDTVDDLTLQLQDPKFEQVEFFAPQSRDAFEVILKTKTDYHNSNCMDLTCLELYRSDFKECLSKSKVSHLNSLTDSFSELFRHLTAGDGDAKLEIVDGDEEQGGDSATVEVAFRPNQDRHRWLSALSNGEKLVVALALFAATHCSGNTPVILFDELDTHLGPDYKRSLSDFLHTLSGQQNMQVIAASFASDVIEDADCIFEVMMHQKATRVQKIDAIEAGRLDINARR